MDKDRQNIRGGFLVIGSHSGFSNIAATAGIAVIVLITSTLWQSHMKIEGQKSELTFVMPAADASSDAADQKFLDDFVSELSLSAASATPTHLGPLVMDQLATSYANMLATGEYTSEKGRELGTSVASMIHTDLAVTRFARSDFSIISDTSKEGGVTYQDALYEAFAPLRENQTAEFEIFARYIETKDISYLVELRHVADLYHSSAANVTKLPTPSDAVSYAISLANALSEFGAVLDALAEHADDPIGSVALLRSYNSAEQEVLGSFNAMRLFYANKLK